MSDLLRFIAFLRQGVQDGAPTEPLTRFELNAIIEKAIARLLSGEVP